MISSTHRVKLCVLASLLGVLLDRPAAAQQTLVDFGSTWRFFRGTQAPSDPDANEWRTPGFDDGGWEVGTAGIGYGDGDDATVLDDMQDNYSSVFLRQTFNVDDATSLTSLLLSIRVDDGFVCYVNGVEAGRLNAGVAGTDLAFDDFADGNHEANVTEYIDVSLALGSLQDGENLLAFHLLNTTIGSSDLSFDVRLSGNDPRIDCVGDITCTKGVDSVTISWTSLALFDSIAVTRDGVAIPGSPFAGDLTSVVDTAPGDFLSQYDVTFTIGGAVCETVSCAITPEFVLIGPGENWTFFRGVEAPSDPPTAWRQPGFDDSSWEVGPTGIGYGDGDDATELADMPQLADDPLTPNIDESQPGYIAFFARRTFEVGDTSVFRNLSLSVDYDDGFIAYLNGVEVARSDSMGGAAAAGTEFAFDEPALMGHEANGAEVFDLTGSIGDLNAGANVLAVEIHNVALGSSDASFIPTLQSNTCDLDLACAFDDVDGTVTLTIDGITADSIRVLRNGQDLPGSPFDGLTTTIIDDSPAARDNVYEVLAVVAGVECAAETCTIACSDQAASDSVTCELDLVGGVTQGTLGWTTPAGVTSIEIFREGALQATVDPSESSYVDPDVESDEPEGDTDYEISFGYADGTTCTVGCGPISLCPENLTCNVVDGGGGAVVELAWDNVVKEWESFTIQVDGVDLAVGVPGDATGFIDDTTVLELGIVHTYTLIPVAPPGEELAAGTCESTCSVALQIEEIGDYSEPAGGWDYRIDFAAGEDQYVVTAGLPGNLDGNWIRAPGLDSWDGSAPDEIGLAPDGAAPGGVSIESVPGGGPCGETISVLRIVDPGDPSAPGASLAAVYPDPYDEPNNRTVFLGLDTGIGDRNLLRDGVTFSARWRVNPDAPEYLNASATGDGSPITGGIGQVGLYFVDDGSLGTEGSTAALSFSLQSGQELEMSTDPVSTLPATDILTFRSIWVTVEDPEADETYEITVYMNGDADVFEFLGTGTDVALISGDPDLGAAVVGNFLGIGMPSGGNDGDIQIDYIAFKQGVHAPSTSPCEPASGFKRGDVDGNGLLEVTDPINNLSFQFLGTFQPQCRDTADFDDNGSIEITDPIGNLSHQFLGQPPPPAPGKDSCGPDPTPDKDGVDLGCDFYDPANCN